MRMAAVQRTLPGGECVAALWLHDAQVQKHVSNGKPLTVAVKISVIGGISAAGWDYLEGGGAVGC